MACNGVFTNLFRRKYANVHDVGAMIYTSPRSLTYPGYPADGAPHGDLLKVSHFKIGCAKLPPGAPTPPLDPDYTDLVAWAGGGPGYCPVDFESTDPGLPEVKPGGAVGSDFYFCKRILPAFVSVSVSDLLVQCRIEAPEANDDGFGFPHFYELGIFDTDDDMIAYVTFAEQVKTPTVAIQHNVTITF